MKRQTRIRLIIFIVFVLVSAVLVENKKLNVTSEKEKSVESVLSLLIEKGVPIHVAEAIKKPIQEHIPFTLVPCEKNFYCTYVSGIKRDSIRIGQKVYFSNSSNVFGTVNSVSNRQDYRNGLYLVKVIKSRSSAKIPSDSGEKQIIVTMVTQSKNSPIVVPYSSIQRDSDGVYLWVVSQNKKDVKKVKVEVGIQNLHEISVENGIDEGDLIVTRGQNLLESYGKFRIIDETQV